METLRRRRLLHEFFYVSVIVKGVDGVLEIVGGLLLLWTSPAQLWPIARRLTQHELAEDPRDLVANYLLQRIQHLSPGTELFGSVYLLWHGAIKVGLVTALLLKVRWAYPAAIVAFFLFLVYQIYRYTLTHAPELIALSVLDVFVIALTWIEYQRLARHH